MPLICLQYSLVLFAALALAYTWNMILQTAQACVHTSYRGAKVDIFFHAYAKILGESMPYECRTMS